MSLLFRQQFHDLNHQRDAQQLFVQHRLQSAPARRHRRRGWPAAPVRPASAPSPAAIGACRSGARRLNIDALDDEPVRRRGKAGEHLGNLRTERTERNLVRRQNRQIVGHGMTVKIIGLRTGRVVIRNADALDAVQRIDLRRKKNFRNGFHLAQLRGQRSQAAGRKFHQRALRLKGKIIFGRQGHAGGIGFMLQLVNGPAERGGKRFARNGIGARVGNRRNRLKIIRRLSNPLPNLVFLFACAASMLSTLSLPGEGFLPVKFRNVP